MALNASRAWLIAYDIASPRRLGRLGAFIKKRAVPVQYSVYYFEGSPAQLAGLMKEIGARIDASRDDVRAYPIPDNPEVAALGRRDSVLGDMLLPNGLGGAFTREEA